MYNINLDEMKISNPRQFFSELFFGQAPRRGREKPLDKVLKMVYYKNFFRTTSGRPIPYLLNVKLRNYLYPPPKRMIFSAIETILSGELVEGSIYLRVRSLSLEPNSVDLVSFKRYLQQ